MAHASKVHATDTSKSAIFVKKAKMQLMFLFGNIFYMKLRK